MNKLQERYFKLLIETIKESMDFNPDNYKIKPLRRRILSRMRRVGIDNYLDYRSLLYKNPAEVNALKKSLTINLTRFFRNKAVFKLLRENLLSKMDDIYVWSAGCANGAEVYSVSIICQELGKKCHVIGTDIDAESLRRAHNGIYNDYALKEIDPAIKKKYFVSVNSKEYKIIDEIRNLVTFEQKDLKDMDYNDDFDLIICRNVLIYLSRDFQKEIFLKFYRALKQGGYLILGKVETLIGETRNRFKPIDINNRIYEKK